MIYNWSKMINRALWLYTQRAGITYCLGCSGEVAGRDAMVENQWKYYYNDPKWHATIGATIPGWYDTMSTGEAWEKWLSVYGGKMCFDCSGFLCWGMGYEGQHMYSSWDFGSMTKQPSVPEGIAGSALFKKTSTGAHVGLDIGYGACLDIANFGGSINLSMIGDRGWTSSHLITGVDYIGADAR